MKTNLSASILGLATVIIYNSCQSGDAPSSSAVVSIDQNDAATYASWIWYPADREIWLGNEFNNRRTERGAMYPPFWKQDSHWQTVEFSKSFVLTEPETIHIAAEGTYNFMFDGKLQFGQPATFTVPAGEHKLNIKVHHVAAPPSLCIWSREGSVLNTDSTWLVTYEDKIWIDENGVAHGSGIYLPAATWPGCNNPQVVPSAFQLMRTELLQPASVRRVADDVVLVDFGRETMGYVTLHDATGDVEICYGESEAEAMDRDYCETLDRLTSLHGDTTIAQSKAFRYVQVIGKVKGVSMLYEYLPHDLTLSGSFECSDEELNRIWQVGAYTMDLTTREFMMDGIKRDRWTWSGDAIQSYLMNYYLRFDSEAVKRTIRQLRGKDPVSSHVNTILDYTFYWFNAIGDYYLYTGDAAFVREMYPKMQTLMQYALSRLSKEGLAIGQPDDWVFVDWVDFPMHKRGILSFEQMLFARSLETMQHCADLVGDASATYGAMARDVRRKTDQLFWSDRDHAYLHALEPELNRQITKFPNMFAILYDCPQQRAEAIMQHVLDNPEVPAITTPYMRFYELAALCQMGRQPDVLHEMKDYWGGMLRHGATSFWEKYVPDTTSADTDSPQAPHLEMYGRPYGKSLCHAWGASPIYLIGRYYLGVVPTAPGYAAWEARPDLGGLEWMRGDVPTPFGPIHLDVQGDHLTISAPEGIGAGTVYYRGQQVTVQGGQQVQL